MGPRSQAVKLSSLKHMGWAEALLVATAATTTAPRDASALEAGGAPPPHATASLAHAQPNNAETTTVHSRARRAELQNRKWRLAFPAVQHITADELQERLLLVDKEWPPVLVDCRSAKEYEVSTIPGAIRVEDIDPHSAGAIVCFCTVGLRSSMECQRLQSLGRRALSMDGVLAWIHAGGEMVVPSTGEPTRKVHIFDRSLIQCLPTDVQPVWYSFGEALKETVLLLLGLSSSRSPSLIPFILAELWRRLRASSRSCARLLGLRRDPFMR